MVALQGFRVAHGLPMASRVLERQRAEDVVVVVVGGPDLDLLVILDLSPFGEQGDGGWVEVQDVASASLGSILEDDVVVVDERL